ncbi:Pentatricopeptide repeat-containing protein [Acorus calamus]|uniref:Pentatricopeptide repeat-containing protein n=1 Tax=Acorus calamus TaxID=4465 RepID=A0AAV9D7T2_ACOCL|nr:Pentatricopeptide repeat-containing protein [Acorus calamus]
MIEDRQNPDRSSLISALTSCRNLLKRVEGRQLHSQVVKRIPPADVILGNVLIAFYARCGDIDEALRAFDEITKRDLVSWNSMLSGYLQCGLYREAWEFFAMMHRQYIGFSDDSFSVAAKCCGSFRGAREGEELHCLAVKAGFESHVVVASMLLDMYSKCGEIGMARKVFDSMAEPNIVSWTSIITGCVRCDRGEDALRLFRDQLRIGIRPDPYSFSSIISACANLPALLFGRSVHALAVRSGYEFETFTCNSLVEMYSRCGCLSDARRVHDSMGVRDVITWTSMISGCAQHGEGQTALEIFEQMIREGVKPNWVTFVAVLSACGRSGLVDEGVYHFHLMGEVYGVEAREEHYTCLVDLLARAGRVHEAYEIIKKRMPFQAGASTWGALLNGCRVIGELKLGLICAEELLVLEPNTASNHVLLANMYAKNGMWEEMGRVRGLMKEKGLKKESGYSWIEVGKEMYVFGAGDSQHALHEFMFEVLRCLSEEMEENSERFHDIEMDVWFQI